MSPSDIVKALSAAGHFPQLLDVKTWSASPVVDTARSQEPDGSFVSPLIRTFQDFHGRWVLTVFGEQYCQVPKEGDVPTATIAMLRAMDNRMWFSPDVIQQYNLIELDPSEFETGDE